MGGQGRAGRDWVDWVYAEQWYVIITFDVTDIHPDRVSEIHANKAVEAGCTNKLCPFQ